MQPDEIRLSYTDPITGRRVGKDWGRQFVEIDGVVLVVKHIYRARSRYQWWDAEAYTDHLESGAALEWAKGDNPFGFTHRGRADLLRQISECVGTEEWTRKRAAWMAVQRERRWSGTYRVVHRDRRQWWVVPNDPVRDVERGPFASKEVAHAELGNLA